MKKRTPEQLKGQIRSFAFRKKLQPQEVLQMYMFERILERLSKSEYAANFVLKGGLLISSLFGIDERTTMDMDTSVVGIPMQEDEIKRIVSEIISVDVGDNISFEFTKIEPIREDDEYNNFRACFVAHFGKIANQMKMDITTGDVITPGAIDYSYKTFFDNEIIPVKAYNIETVIAEKYETIIRRSIDTTRARDFYDLYMFFNLYEDRINYDTLKDAVNRTAKKRGSEDELSRWMDICEEMRHDEFLIKLWNNYQNNNPFSQNISFEKVIDATEEIGKKLQ